MPREKQEILWSKVRKKKDVGALVHGVNLTEKQAIRESQKLKRLLENYIVKYELRKKFLQKYCPHKYENNEGVETCSICDKQKVKDLYLEDFIKTNNQQAII